jgi:hypothetical protein
MIAASLILAALARRGREHPRLPQAGGQFGGQNLASGGLCLLRLPVRASVSPGQRLRAGHRDLPVAHGKEKVYGSIP